MGVKEYVRDNSELLEAMFNRYFFNNWKIPAKKRDPHYSRLELMVTADCNLGCKYCYIHRHGKKLYKPEIREHDLLRKNLDIVLDWLIENNYTPEVDFFSGSPLSQEITLELLEKIYERYKEVPKEKRIPSIVIPTNFTFILSDELIKRVEDLIEKFRNIGISMLLSASIEGKYMEQNRPFRFNQPRDRGLFLPEKDLRNDEYYDKVFRFAKKHNCGFHPMVYSNDIHLWQKNFLWFQDMFRKHEIPYYNIYLLEVRNIEWTDEQIRDYLYFVEFLIRWTWKEICKEDKNKFMDFMIKRRGYNILVSTLFRKARGTTCSLQTMFYIRLGDLKIIPCHRQCYDGYEFGKFIIKNDKIIGIEAINTEMAIGIFSNESKNQPYCVDCIIKEICPSGCLGSQLESNGDPFTPIPTVCELYHKKIYTELKVLEDIGVLELIKNRVDEKLGYLYDEILELGGN